jgi:predicted TIM-barrel fold metal-dependent hydrolase
MSQTGGIERTIVDPHHHLWTHEDRGAGHYLLDDLRADTDTVPAVGETVFVQCGAQHRTWGPGHLRPVGETEFVSGVAEASDTTDGATIAGIVGFADLTLPTELLDEVLDAHQAAGGGRFRGIRDALARAPDGVPLTIPGRAAPGKAADPRFRLGLARLGDRGLTYDSWHYHTQNRDFLDLARAVPETTMVLDHFGTPLGVGPWEGRHDEVFGPWCRDVADLARCPNVVAKLGGLAMPDNGYGWHTHPSHRPDAPAFVAAQERWYHHAIESFGPDRCMFESNFPVDKASVDYAVVWEALGLIAARYAADEQESLFAGTARRVYRL